MSKAGRKADYSTCNCAECPECYECTCHQCKRYAKCNKSCKHNDTEFLTLRDRQLLTRKDVQKITKI